MLKGIKIVILTYLFLNYLFSIGYSIISWIIILLPFLFFLKIINSLVINILKNLLYFNNI
jgi:hypothetical protein